MVKNLLLWVVIALVLLTVFQNVNTPESTPEVNYSSFVNEVRNGEIKSIETTGLSITGERKNGSKFTTVRPYIEDPSLFNDLWENGVEVAGREPEQPSIWRQLLIACFPILIIIAVFMFFMRQMQGGGGGRGGPMAFGRSKARLLGEDQIKTTFADVAGCDEAKEEVKELVEFLRDLPQAVLVFQEHTRTGRDFLVTGDGQTTDNTKRWFEMNQMLVTENRHPTAEDLRHSLRVGVVATGRSAFEAQDRLIERFSDRVDLHCFAGVPTTKKEDAVYIVEIFAKGVNKWRGVHWLAQQHGIGPKAVAAIGDEINDLAMLEHAGLGVAMANAVPRAAEKADVRTLSNADHGVAHAITQMLDGAW